ncbi:MAG: transcriptional repressor NrdR, partial [Planctomycetes bacterium]|nr:transcriptional repressor NrdR [Planctomycetota bacterium]
HIRRRRECLNCRRRYSTYERPEAITIKVVKKDGRREQFSSDKIRRGVERACGKRPVSGEQIDQLVAAVVGHVYAESDSEIESRTLGELVMKHLRQLDQVAFVRFASVYREFKDVTDFVHELQPILEDRESGSPRTGH